MINSIYRSDVQYNLLKMFSKYKLANKVTTIIIAKRESKNI